MKLKVDNPEKLVFTSDLHFCHASIIGFCGRPFQDVDEMNDALIRNWREAVSEDDEVVILGDLFWRESGADEYLKIIPQLPGKKHLVLGNHDYFSESWYLNAGLASVQSYLEVHAGHEKIICFHYPMREWRWKSRGAVHLHGHTHGGKSRKYASFAEEPGSLDVGVDAHGYSPVRWTDLRARLGLI